MSLKDVLIFWFPSNGLSYQKFWFSDDTETDRMIRDIFSPLLTEAEKNTEVYLTCTDPQDLLALVILFDQFTRCIYRGTRDYNKNDKIARQLADRIFLSGYSVGLTVEQQIFALMPYRHSYNLCDTEFVVGMLEEFEQSDNSLLLKQFKRNTLRQQASLLTI